MTTLDELMYRVKVTDPRKAEVAELVRLGFRGDVTDEDKAQHIMVTGEATPAQRASIVAAYQEFWKPNLDEIAHDLLGKDFSVSGDVDRPTLESITHRLCPVPDVHRAVDGTIMEARWPDSCKDGLTWDVNWSGFSEGTFGLTKDGVHAEFVQAFYDMMRLFNVTLKEAAGSQAHFEEGFDSLGRGTLGVHYLANNTCQSKGGRFNIMRWPSLDYLGQVIRHEITHGLGLGHVPGHTLMNPSIVWPLNGQIEATGWTQRDIDAVLGLGYKRATTPPPKPNDPTDPTPTAKGFKGYVVLRNAMGGLPAGTRIEGKDIAEVMSHVKLL